MIIYGNISDPGPDVSIKDDIIIEKTTTISYHRDKNDMMVPQEMRCDQRPIPVPGILRAIHVTTEDIPDNFCIIQEGWNDTHNNTDGRWYEMYLKNHKITIHDERTAIEYFKILCTQFPDDETVMSEKYSMLAI